MVLSQSENIASGRLPADVGNPFADVGQVCGRQAARRRRPTRPQTTLDKDPYAFRPTRLQCAMNFLSHAGDRRNRGDFPRDFLRVRVWSGLSMGRRPRGSPGLEFGRVARINNLSIAANVV